MHLIRNINTKLILFPKNNACLVLFFSNHVDLIFFFANHVEPDWYQSIPIFNSFTKSKTNFSLSPLIWNPESQICHCRWLERWFNYIQLLWFLQENLCNCAGYIKNYKDSHILTSMSIDLEEAMDDLNLNENKAKHFVSDDTY